MANNLVETVQRSLGFPPLQKIDPNSQEAKQKFLRYPQEKLAQAAIPAILTALYRFTRSDEGCRIILSDIGQADWLGVIFRGKETIAVEKCADYAGVTKKEAESAMENIADEAVIILKKMAGSHPGMESIKAIMNAQRHNILVYLPAALQMGDLLNEETLDDRTNKMEGPFSNFMHTIESKLSGSDSSKYP
ncbi:MAG: hypothetical protein Q8941_15990 [Bacteroidota bacterium]|nr:hypothetical protein [Bacteroidota bacterium]